MRKLALLTALLACSVVVVSAETPDEFLDRNEAKVKALKSYESVSEMTMSTPQYQITTSSTTDCKRTPQGVKTLTVGKTTTSVPNQPRVESEVKMVSDGSTVYTESKSGGKTTIAKSKAPADETGYGTIRDYMKKGGASTVKPAEQINGEACGILEIVFTVGDQASTYTYWVSDKTGMLMKMEGKSKAYGDMTLTVKSLKTDIDIADTKFAYEPPAGVPVQDYTGYGAAGAVAPTAPATK
ncbi:MAG: hypothetical protein ABI579_02310 [Candidatus Sumerlaeota bacterium]